MKLTEILCEDWQKVNKHDKTDGMSSKAVKAYRRENPGSKLKTAVTTKPSKLKKGSKSAKRRKSFCARMKGMKKAHASAKTKRNPDSPINKALRRWNCESIEEMRNLIEYAENEIAQLKESEFGTRPKRTERPGSRPARGHKLEPRYKVRHDDSEEWYDRHGNVDPNGAYDAAGHYHLDRDVGEDLNEHKKNRIAKKYTKKPVSPVSPSEVHAKAKAKVNPTPTPKPVEQKVNEKASRTLCKSSTPDEDLGASNLASCKSQGLRARDGNKSHKLGKSPKSRVKMDGHKIKGQKYGGPLPDWS